MDSKTSQQWIVGYFESENKYSVIPINWIYKSCSGNNDVYYCKWPNNSQVTSSMLMKSVKPGQKWSSHPVKVLERFDTYAEAAAREVQLFLTSSAGESDVSNHSNSCENNSSKTPSFDYYYSIHYSIIMSLMFRT